MNKEEITLLKYKDVLEKLKDQECHLLLGNGFNLSLGVNTSYESIFKKMIENDHGIYKEAENIFVESNYDLEQFIGKLENSINDENKFLKKYVKNKVKFDFMKAAHEIVKSGIKNVYAEKNEGIFMLLKNFTNYFTLNYDSFLYLLLLNFKSEPNKETTIAFSSTPKLIEDDMNTKQNYIYSEIKMARKNGTLSINTGDKSTTISEPLSEVTKNFLMNALYEYSKSMKKGWTKKNIDKALNLILEEEKKNNILEKVDDGSRQQNLFDDTTDFVFDTKNETQNLFFLHGAFHIYRAGKEEKKITQETDKALYDRLEEILNNEKQDIICVFASEDKIDEINKSQYLTKCYNKLQKLSGVMVIIGCSLSDNDDHIFKQIHESEINTLYISTTNKNKEKNYTVANNKFNNKKIFLFEAESITYELPDKEKG